MSTIIKILKNRVVQIILVFILGTAVGALFYPTKNIEEKIKQQYEEKLDKNTTEKETIRKTLNEKIDKITGEKTELRIEMTKKVSQLTIQIKELESKTKESYYKIIKPDGTIEIKTYKESEVNESSSVVTDIKEEFNKKVTEISDKWKKIHTERVEELKKDFDKKEQEYINKITQLEKKTSIEINPKKYGVDIGYLSNKNFYAHSNIDIFGPLFLGIHMQTNFTKDFAVGAGIGVRF